MGFKKGKEVPTIDVVLVTIKTTSGEEIALDTANKIAVEIQSQTTEAVQLIVKGKLIAQKKAKTTITGNAITLTDNVFNYQVARILQGGTIKYDADETTIIGYEPPVVGSDDTGEVFELCAYSAIYDEAGLIQGYEKVTYPNCTGNPFGLGSEDGVFRVQEQVINSAPSKGQAPYSMDIVEELPAVEEYVATTNSQSTNLDEE